MDGVLVDAKEWHYEALNKALSLFGIPISREDHINKYDGLPTRKKLQMLKNEKNLPGELHEFINEIKQIYTEEIIYFKCKPVFEVQYAMNKLKSEGYKIAVCSNSVRNSVKVMMEKSSLIDLIDIYISNEDVDKGKPDPEMYLKAMKYFNLNADECLILEDNENGIKAAIDSGGHLLKIEEVTDTNYHNIKNRIKEIEEKKL